MWRFRENSAAVLTCNAEDRWKEAVVRECCIAKITNSSAYDRKEQDIDQDGEVRVADE